MSARQDKQNPESGLKCPAEQPSYPFLFLLFSLQEARYAMGLLQQTITWYKIRHTGGQKNVTRSKTKRL